MGCIYRHPRHAVGSTSDFIETFYEKLEKLSNTDTPLVLLGDVNLNTNDTSDDAVLSYKNMLSSVGCENLIKVPTHFWEKGRSLLDHVISNIDPVRIQAGVLNNGKPGHLPTYAIVKGHSSSKTNENEEADKQKWRYLDEKKKDHFLSILEEKLKHLDLNDHPEKLLSALTIATQSAIDICFPLKTKSNRAKKRSLTPWFDGEIYKAEKKQSRLFRKFFKFIK